MSKVFALLPMDGGLPLVSELTVRWLGGEAPHPHLEDEDRFWQEQALCRAGRVWGYIKNPKKELNSLDLDRSAQLATEETDRILHREGDIRGVTSTSYTIDIELRNVTIQGESAGLALALAFATKVRSLLHREENLTPVLAATGIIKKGGGIGKIGQLCEKLKAALNVLPKSNGVKVLYPQENSEDITELENIAKENGVELCAVNTLYDALVCIGVRFQRINLVPFPGLTAYRYEDAPVFFGRDREVNEIINRLETHFQDGKGGILLIQGASGSGKSSLVQAGVIPALERRFLPKHRLRRWSVLKPSMLLKNKPGEVVQPWAAFVAAYCQSKLLENEAVPLEYPQDLETFLEWMKQRLESLEKNLNIQAIQYVWVIDQLEELFTLGLSSELQEAFCTTLRSLTEMDQLVVMCMNSAFFSTYEKLNSLYSYTYDKIYPLPPLDKIALDRMIQRPAWLAVYEYEVREYNGIPDINLASRLRDDLGGNVAALPLLSFCLRRLYDKGDPHSRIMTHACYDEIGGIQGAINTHANEIYSKLAKEIQVENILPKIIRALTTEANLEDGSVVARMVSLDRFPEDSNERRFIEQFCEGRLLVKDKDNHVRVAHEALLTHWPLAKEHIEKNREWFLVHRRLEDRAHRWATVSSAHQTGLLLTTGLDLSQAEGLMQAWGEDVDKLVRKYIAASLHAEQKRQQAEQKRQEEEHAARDERERLLRERLDFEIKALKEAQIRRRRTQIFAGVTSVLLVVAVGLGVVAWQERDNANQQRDAALILIDQIQTDLYKKLESIAKLDLLDDVTKFVWSYFNKFPPTPDDETALNSQADAFINAGSIKLAKKDLAGTFADYNRALEIYQKLVNKDSTNIKWQRGLIQSHVKLGTAYFDKKDYENAKINYDDARQISDSLVKKYPENSDLHSDLIDSYIGIGIALGGQGTSAALSYLLMAEAESKQLKSQTQDNAKWQRRLLKVYINIGVIYRENKNLSDASTYINKALELCKPLAIKNPSNMLWQSDLGFIYYQMGLIKQAQNNLKKASDAYKECITIRERLCSYDPSNLKLQKELDAVRDKYRNLSQVK